MISQSNIHPSLPAWAPTTIFRSNCVQFYAKAPFDVNILQRTWVYLVLISWGGRRWRDLCPMQWPLWTVGGRELVPGPQQPLPHLQQLLPLGNRRLQNHRAGGVEVRLKRATLRDSIFYPRLHPSPSRLRLALHPSAMQLLPCGHCETKHKHLYISLWRPTQMRDSWAAAFLLCVWELKQAQAWLRWIFSPVGSPLLGVREMNFGALWKSRPSVGLLHCTHCLWHGGVRQ